MRTITRQELKARLDAGEDIKLVMAVGGWTFRARHIPGSLGFPSPSCALRELGRDDDIIVYSTDQHLQNSAAAFDALTAHGYRNVCCYTGGLADWEDAGYPVEGDSVGPTSADRGPHGHSPQGPGAGRRLPALRQRLVRLRLAAGGNHGPGALGFSAAPDDGDPGCPGRVVSASRSKEQPEQYAVRRRASASI